jgi:hypothetical protein
MNHDMINAHIVIKASGMNEEQREIQRYQDTYKGSLFRPKTQREERTQKPWGTKFDAKGNPVPQSQWKPLYIPSIAKWIVSFHTSKLFSEDAFPDIKAASDSPDIYTNLQLPSDAEDKEAARKQAANDELQKVLTALLEQVEIQDLCQDASDDALVQGFIPILFSVWDSEIYAERLDRKWTKIEYDPKRPKVIILLREQYILKECDERGREREYLYRREIDQTTWREWKALIEDPGKLPILTSRHLTEDFVHDLGFVPVVKMCAPKDQSIFADEISDNIEGLIRYDNNISHSITKNLDPQRYMLVDSNGSELEMDDVENLAGEDEGSEVLESGTLWPLKAKSVGDFSTQGSHETALKDLDSKVLQILESCHVVRVPNDNDQSGVALDLRLEPAKAYINKLRVSMGRKGLVEICHMVLAIALRLQELGQFIKLPTDVQLPKNISNNTFKITLDWGDIIPVSEKSKADAIFNAKTAKESGFISNKSAMRYVASFFGIEDLEAEQELIDLEREQNQSQAMMAQNNQFQIKKGEFNA